ncbi:hypothetical protein PPL_07628 [Heterostelium album PN500]|uniref:Uncharacterized protein n=1 Tax=Heterostelium pallidum (strain ATCC 26659 / Pp 5 / PN500) TaxID=670386 RepID=D3BGH7_HETP5|nr:hypothetical protein PPL_07628 [Heterostelium album PN500]EFA79577.1 hypothetical protein PPL_07628 [Heterostelium album PN500]|eukprot:XP_020431698.1 hypothetical protein PPL_07628 [Heterostelium album PN500]
MFKNTVTLFCREATRKQAAKFNSNQATRKYQKSLEINARIKEEKKQLKQAKSDVIQDPLVIRAYKELEEEGYFSKTGAINPLKDQM